MQKLKTLTAFGTTRTLQEWATLRGIKRQTILSRIKQGWSIPRALRTKPRPHRDRTLKWRAFDEIHTLPEWARKIGINYATLYSRVRDHGLTIEAALTCEKYYTQKAQPRKTHCVNGHPLTGPGANIYECVSGRSCRRCRAKWRGKKVTAGLPGSMCGPRIALAGLRYSMRGCLWDAFGRSSTLTQWASEFGIKYNTLYQRLDRGWPLEVALTEKPSHLRLDLR